jgi:hypothetical protein
MANEKRIRLNNVAGTLGNIMLFTDTTATFAVSPGFGTIGTTNHAAIIMEPGTTNEEVIYLTAFTPAATTGTILRAQEGTTAVQHANGVPWIHGQTVRDNSAGRLATVTLSSGNVAVTSATFVAVVSGGTFDVTVSGYVADWIEVGVNGCWASTASTSAAAGMDAATFVSSAAVNFLSTGTGTAASNGIGGWLGPNVAVQSSEIGGSAFYRLQAADISANTVTVRLFFRLIAGTTRSIQAGSTPLQFWVKNHGPQEN